MIGNPRLNHRYRKGFYSLFKTLQQNQTKEVTAGQVVISPGTMYGTLSKMEKDGLIRFVREEDKRKFYRITETGREILDIELARIERLYRNSKGENDGD
ncbi:PadR family transcriptional regulator [Streptococcus suis]